MMMEKTQNKRHCKDCIHSIFNEQWGDYRCKKFTATIYDNYRATTCQYFEERKK